MPKPALRITWTLVNQQGFDPIDIGERVLAGYDTRPFKIGQMALSLLSQHKYDDAWHEAG